MRWRGVSVILGVAGRLSSRTRGRRRVALAAWLWACLSPLGGAASAAEPVPPVWSLCLWAPWGGDMVCASGATAEAACSIDESNEWTATCCDDGHAGWSTHGGAYCFPLHEESYPAHEVGTVDSMRTTPAGDGCTLEYEYTLECNLTDWGWVFPYTEIAGIVHPDPICPDGYWYHPDVDLCVPDCPMQCEQDDDPCTYAECLDWACETFYDDGQSCDDGLACTENDLCAGGECVGIPIHDLDCEDGLACTEDTCEEPDGCVHEPLDERCEDLWEEPCEIIVCDLSWGCIGQGKEDGTSCEDGDACTSGDTCMGGACTAGELIDCGPAQPCWSPWCDPDVGCVLDDTDGDPCDDGLACTQGDHCQGGACMGTVLGEAECDDGIECTLDSCQEPAGCVHEPVDLLCAGGVTDCEQPVCDPRWGCMVHTLDGIPCDDGDACTEVDVCQGGECWGSIEPSCDDGDPCTDDFCESPYGCTHTPTPGACTTCAPSAALPDLKVSLTHSIPLTSACPGFLGGSAGFQVGVSGSATSSSAPCPACTSSFAVEASVSVTAQMCAGQSASIQAGGSYKGTAKRCQQCNEATCGLECGEVQCREEEFSSFTNATVTRPLKFRGKTAVGGSGGIPAIQLRASCGVNLSVSVGGKATIERKEPGSCQPCAACNSNAHTFTLGGSASGGCFVELAVSKQKALFGCEGCAELGLEVGVTGSSKSGACGSGGCTTGTVSASAALGSQCSNITLLWYDVGLACSLGAKGSCKAGCGQGGCGVDNVYAACTIRRGGCG